MLDLTLLAVKHAALLLIETNGKTTTLEVKTLLRTLDYRANQTEVSDLLEQASEELPLDFTTNGVYREYTLPIPSTLAGDGSTTSPVVPISTGSGYDTYTKRNGDTVLGYHGLETFSSEWWKVSSDYTDNVYYFDRTNLTRDEVRQAFASLTGVAYHSTRAISLDN